MALLDENGVLVLWEEIKALIATKTVTTLPDDNIVEVDMMYFLGEVKEVTVGFPEKANMGDMVFVSFKTGATIPEISITTENHAGLDDINLKANYYYELIGLWNGSAWAFVKYEVSL